MRQCGIDPCIPDSESCYDGENRQDPSMSASRHGARPRSGGHRRIVADRRRPPGGPRAPGRRRPVPGHGGLKALSSLALRWFLRLAWRLSLGATAAVALLIGGATVHYHSLLPDVATVSDVRARGSVTMLDRDGDVFAWRGEQFGGIVTPDTASPHLTHAVIATEDRRFRRHPGIDPRGIASAIRINLREGRGPLEGHGGSTITQQVAKLMCLGVPFDPETWESEADYEADCRRTTLWRKLQEVPFAFAMELRYTKDEILSIYFNRAYLGAGARGFEGAAQRYFGVSAAALDPARAAMLAGLLTAPSYYAPTRNLARAQERAAVVVGLMERDGYLSAPQAEAARAEPAVLSEAAKRNAGGAFADWIVATGPDFLTRDTTEDVVIDTTFDADMQAAAEAALADVFETQVRAGSRAQAAIVVMSADGAVRAMVGGRDTRGTGLFNRATQAMRQTGSAFKPFVYATALDLGWRFDDTILDAELTIDVPGSGPYAPTNYTGEFQGEVTLTEALGSSLNTPAVRLSERVGRDLVRGVATEFGIGSDLALGPALALGASEATLIEMTGAYAGILNGGSAVAPYGVRALRFQGEASPLFEQASGIQERVISDSAARQLIYMMSEAVADGTGRRARLPDRPAAGKTGTTQAARDAWFVGFTADYVAGVWMGYDDNTPLTGVTGGGLPAEIWRRTMERIHADLPARALPAIDPATVPRRAREAPGATGDAGAARPEVAGPGLLEVLGGLLGRN